MATTEERRRRRQRKKMGKLKKREKEPTTVDDLPDHLVERILLCLGSLLCFVRATAACRRWHRLVTAAGFLARSGSLDAPNVIGYYHAVRGRPVFVPSSAAAAPVGVDNRRFSLDFLPDSGHWDLVDSRGSLLLLSKNMTCQRRRWMGWCSCRICRSSGDLIVCEPLTQRCQGILRPRLPDSGIGTCGVFLVDGGADADRRIGMSNFRVIAPVYSTHAWVFSPGSDGGWRQVRSVVDVQLPVSFNSANFVGRANGSLYWGIEGHAAAGVLVLDETTAKFSLVAFPENVWGPYDKDERASRVIGGDDGALRVVRLINNDLKVFTRRRPAGDDEWVLEKLLNLPEATVGLPGREERFFQQEAMIVAANARYLLVAPREMKTWVFTVELDAMEVEREHERNKYAGEAYPYELPWPPAFGLDRADRRRT